METDTAHQTPAEEEADESLTSHALFGSWNPIETGPKDGTEVLVTGLDYGKGPSRHLLIARWEAGEGMWADHYTDASGSTHLCHLTHWMPLPSLPNAGALATAPQETENKEGRSRGRQP